MKIIYIADFILPSNRAYAIHVFKMLDAFSDHGFKSQLFIPYFEKKKITRAINFFDMKNLRSIKIKKIFKKKINLNSINRLIFGYAVAKKSQNFDEDSLIISRSLMASIFLTFFKTKHFLEIHQEIKGLTKFFLINMNLINSKYIIKNIFISKSLANFYKNKVYRFKVLHDGVDITKFKKKKKITNGKKISYVGSFYKGRGIKLIIEIAKELKDIEFFLYGKRNEKFKKLPKNIFLQPFVEQSKIPNILNKSDLLLLPYSSKVHISSDGKSADNSRFMSPLKLFESLASGTPTLCSNIKVLREILKNNYNSILINKFEDKNEWIIKIKEISKNKNKLNVISKNAIITSKKYTWFKRSKIFIDIYNN